MAVFTLMAALTIGLWHATAEQPRQIMELGLTVLAGTCLFFMLQWIGAYRRVSARAELELEERREAALAAQLSEARYRSVFDSASEGLMVMHEDGQIIEANEAACSMHGYPPGGLVGMPVRELIAPGHRHQYHHFVDHLARFGEVSLESVDIRSDGDTLDVQVNGVGFIQDGQPAILAIINDVTERREALRRQEALSRKVLVAQEEERARVSRDLHDGLGQLLTAARLQVDFLGRQLDPAQYKLEDGFHEAAGLIEHSAVELRRICRGLRPPLLDDLGLEPSIEQLVDEFREVSAIAIDCTIQLDEERTVIPPEVSLCTFRVLQESLTNVTRHSSARRVTVALNREYTRIVLSVYDNGKGFNDSDIPDTPGFGIAGMKERAKLVNGECDIRSTPDQGTRVTLRIPLEPVREEVET